MANSALIEDLRKQFAENPRRVFARLANEYRKSGDLDVAIEICRAQVPLQPTYISGFIVFGQALFEHGDFDEARSIFETALSLDPENLIALRQLGDIARNADDLDAARGWYHKLLEVDPQNEEISAQLQALDTPAPGSAAADHSEQPAADAEPDPVSWNDIHPGTPSVTPLASQATQPSRPRFSIGVIPENLPAEDDSASRASSSPGRSAPAPAATEAIIELEPPSDKVAGTSGLPEYVGAFDRHSPTPPTASPVVPETHPGVLPMVDIEELAPQSAEKLDADLPPLQTSSEQAAAPATAAKLASLSAGPELETPRHDDSATGADDAPSPTSSLSSMSTEESYDPTIGRMVELNSRSSTDALLPELMMTESGAELLREQGHIDQAIYVYRQLAAKNPGDSSYTERIASLESGALSSIPLIASISQEVISAAKNRPTSTQSIRAFFTSLASRRSVGSDTGHHVGAASAQALTAPATTVAEPSTASPEDEADSSESPQDPWSAASLEHTTSFAVPPEAAHPSQSTSSPAPASSPPETVSEADRSAFETLFAGNAAVAPADERAASSLASAFSEEFSSESSGPAGQPTRAASDALSLDSVFQSSRSRSDNERSGQPDVSFDQFFSSRENGGTAGGSSETAVETASRREDSQSDLELFHEWLDGLKK